MQRAGLEAMIAKQAAKVRVAMAGVRKKQLLLSVAQSKHRVAVGHHQAAVLALERYLTEPPSDRACCIDRRLGCDVMQQIFEYLSFSDVLTVQLVSKQWYGIVCEMKRQMTGNVLSLSAFSPWKETFCAFWLLSGSGKCVPFTRSPTAEGPLNEIPAKQHGAPLRDKGASVMRQLCVTDGKILSYDKNERPELFDLSGTTAPLPPSVKVRGDIEWLNVPSAEIPYMLYVDWGRPAFLHVVYWPNFTGRFDATVQSRTNLLWLQQAMEPGVVFHCAVPIDGSRFAIFFSSKAKTMWVAVVNLYTGLSDEVFFRRTREVFDDAGYAAHGSGDCNCSDVETSVGYPCVFRGHDDGFAIGQQIPFSGIAIYNVSEMSDVLGRREVKVPLQLWYCHRASVLRASSFPRPISLGGGRFYVPGGLAIVSGWIGSASFVIHLPSESTNMDNGGPVVAPFETLNFDRTTVPIVSLPGGPIRLPDCDDDVWYVESCAELLPGGSSTVEWCADGPAAVVGDGATIQLTGIESYGIVSVTCTEEMIVLLLSQGSTLALYRRAKRSAFLIGFQQTNPFFVYAEQIFASVYKGMDVIVMKGKMSTAAAMYDQLKMLAIGERPVGLVRGGHRG